MTSIKTHPVQTIRGSGQARAPTAVTMAAYEVYCHIHSPQEAMVIGGCRGGFSSGELIGFLYARSFSKEEWSKRVIEWTLFQARAEEDLYGLTRLLAAHNRVVDELESLRSRLNNTISDWEPTGRQGAHYLVKPVKSPCLGNSPEDERHSWCVRRRKKAALQLYRYQWKVSDAIWDEFMAERKKMLLEIIAAADITEDQRVGFLKQLR